MIAEVSGSLLHCAPPETIAKFAPAEWYYAFHVLIHADISHATDRSEE